MGEESSRVDELERRLDVLTVRCDATDALSVQLFADLASIDSLSATVVLGHLRRMAALPRSPLQAEAFEKLIEQLDEVRHSVRPRRPAE